MSTTTATAAATTLGLVRGWAVDWLASHDATACDRLLAPDYRLTIGAVVLDGREAYVAATVGQLANFPGLGLTIHDVVVSGDHAAVRFTEHGAALNRDGNRAVWVGVTLFRTDAGRLVECWAEEDYASRSAQLAVGRPATPEPPAVAPWDTAPEPPDPEAEDAVRRWLAAPTSPGVVRDDGGTVVDDEPVLAPIEVDVLFSAGRAVAFHGRSPIDGFATGVSGLLRVDDLGAVSGHVVTDRSGLKAHRRRRDG